MGISRDKLHKRRATGGRRKVLRAKRKFELGRAPALTKIGEKRIHLIRTRGGHHKHRALRLNEGHFVWPGEAATKRSRILNVVYNATSNELVRTNTLVKGCIVQIDATPFKQWYEQFYRVTIGKVRKEDESKKIAEPAAKKEEKAPAKKDETAPAKKEEKAPAKKDEKAPPAKKDEKAPAKKDEKATAKKGEKAPAKKDEKAPAKKDEKAPAKQDEKVAEKKEAKKEEPKGKGKKPAAAEKVAEKKEPPKKSEKAPAKPAEKPKAAEPATGPKKPSNHLKRKLNARKKARVLENSLKDQFNTGRILAKISSRPGQSGRADGYILEGEELAFYQRKIDKKRN